MDMSNEHALQLTRRHFFGRASTGIGVAALASLLQSDGLGASTTSSGILSNPHFAPKAKRVIYLFMSGAPSQIDLFDHKPKLHDMFDKDLPDSVVNGQRFTTMTSGQSRFPIAPSMFKFAQHGQSGAWMSELLPHMSSIVDDLTIIKTVNTEAINHDPAITYIQTGSQIAGASRALGAWLSYGLGSHATKICRHSSCCISTVKAKRAKPRRCTANGCGERDSCPSQTSRRQLAFVAGDPVLLLISNPTELTARIFDASQHARPAGSVQRRATTIC